MARPCRVRRIGRHGAGGRWRRVRRGGGSGEQPERRGHRRGAHEPGCGRSRARLLQSDGVTWLTWRLRMSRTRGASRGTASYSWVGRGITMVASLATTYPVARYLGPDKYGQYQLIIALLLLVNVSDFGIATVAMRHLSVGAAPPTTSWATCSRCVSPWASPPRAGHRPVVRVAVRRGSEAGDGCRLALVPADDLQRLLLRDVHRPPAHGVRCRRQHRAGARAPCRSHGPWC